jgi:hypothetical protein
LVADISRFFCKIENLLNSSEEERKAILSEVRTNYKNYIVKPQREGGGNNYYNEDILKLLPQDDNEEISTMLKNAVIMERVNPPEHDSLILHESTLKQVKCVTEYSIFGVLLSDDKAIHTNEEIGFLLRTKESRVQEGGIVSGYSAADLPYLI